MNQNPVGRRATLLLAALTVLAGLALPNGMGIPSTVGIGETAPAAGGQDPWAVWSHKQYDPLDVTPFTRELFERHVAAIDNSASTWDAYVSGLDPAPDLQTQVCRFPTLRIDALVSSKGQDAQESANARRITRAMVVDQLQKGNGLLADLFRAGQIAGVEFDWHHADHMRPRSEMTLPVVGALFTRSDYTDVLVAYIYAYNQSQLIARRQELELDQNRTLPETTTWAVPVLGAKRRVAIVGRDVTVAGDVAARKRIVVKGENANIAGAVSYGETLELCSVPVIDGPLEHVDPNNMALPRVPFSIQEARSLAQQAGMYVSGDLQLIMPPPDGTVIFAEGDVHVHGWGWTRSFTVFAKNSVFFYGSDATLRGAESDTLAVAYNGDIKWMMTNSSVEGLLASPMGDFVAEGGPCAFHGPIMADVVRLVADGLTVNDGTAANLQEGASQVPEDGEGQQGSFAPEDGEQTQSTSAMEDGG